MLHRSREVLVAALSACIWLAAAPHLASPAASALLDVRTSWETAKGERGVRVELPGDDTPLIAPNGQPLLSESACETELDLEPQPGGFDLLLTVRNGTDEPQTRPAIHLTGINLARKTTHLDARDLGHLHELDATGKTSMWSGRFSYPDDLYAPVLAVWDERFAIGLSLVYDVMEAKHDISTFWGAEGGAYTGTYRVHFHLDVKEPKIPETSFVQPGAWREYRLMVRFAKPEDWLDTLEPYREPFRGLYGAVRYEADRTPIWGQPLSQGEYMEDNERGYSPTWRTDLRGWKPTVDWIFEEVLSKGYRRVMLWNPQGLYRVGSNFPPEFMTEWSPKMVETAGELERFREAGVTLGFWWGRASQVSGGFNTGKMWVRDIRNPEDVEAGDRELRLAENYGTDEIGLDAFGAIPLWDRYPWLLRIQEQFPSMRYITEAADCDIMHTIAPTFCTWRRQSQRAVLADWLNPGHETWIQLRWQEVTPERFQQVRDWGLVPCTMSRTVEH